MHRFKSFSRVKSTQNKKVRFIKGNELKLIQVKLFTFFKNVHLNVIKWIPETKNNVIM